jgi:Subtilase family
MASDQFPHLTLDRVPSSLPFTYPGGVPPKQFDRVPRDRIEHSTRLRGELEQAWRNAERVLDSEAVGVQLTYVLTSDAIELVSRLEDLRSGIQLLSAVNAGSELRATIFVPMGKRRILEKVLDQYRMEETRTGRPKNEDLVSHIEQIRQTTKEDLWTDSRPFPGSGEKIWWEVWVHTTAEEAREMWSAFSEALEQAGFRTKPRHVRFPDRVVGLAWGSAEDWSTKSQLLLSVAELRRAKEAVADFVEADPAFQNDLVQNLASRVLGPGDSNVAVCLLDTGVNSEHPLLKHAFMPRDVRAVSPVWSSADISVHQHGTGIAGVALYGSALDELISGHQPIELAHNMESVKILPDSGENEPDSYGAITQDAVAMAEIASPQRKRAVCLTVTAVDCDGGAPSSWSAAIDQLTFGGQIFGEKKLICASVGNLRDQVVEARFQYPMISENCGAGVEDPAQSWNAVSVGAMTERVMIHNPSLKGYQPIAPNGDLCPTSRTSHAWSPDARDDWPYKPEVVLEGGNWARMPGLPPDRPDDLGILTTALKRSGALLGVTGDTSAATATASGLCARIWANYPAYWPETIRALLIHSAEWTPAMYARFPGKGKDAVKRRLRCYGYGKPNEEFALQGEANRATVIFQGQLYPYRLDGTVIKTNQWQLHRLPWPKTLLEDLGPERVILKVTLSYFIEPSPGRRGWTRKHLYPSHGLRFELKRTAETLDAFKRRVSKSDEAGDDMDGEDGGALKWLIGPKARTKGSVHSDSWEGNAAELAACDHLAVFPTSGWWRELKRQKRWGEPAPYALVISVHTERSEIYSAIANEIAVSIET